MELSGFEPDSSEPGAQYAFHLLTPSVPHIKLYGGLMEYPGIEPGTHVSKTWMIPLHQYTNYKKENKNF